MSNLQDFVKSRPSLYRTAKLLRDFSKFPMQRSDALQKMPTIWKIFPQTMLPPIRLYNFADAVDAVNREKIPGSIVECGVWSGGALAFAALWNERTKGMPRDYHGFDSFDGLPAPTPEDDEIYSSFFGKDGSDPATDQPTTVRTGLCKGDAADSVRQFFRDVGVPVERFQLHAGWFQDTLPDAASFLSPIAILRLDGDWYESTKVCLDLLYDAVSPTGYIIIDDYGCFSGCKRAVDEYREAHNIDTPLTWVDEHCVFFRKP